MLTVTEAAILTGRNRDVILRWCQSGRIVAYQSTGGEWVIPPSALASIQTMPRQMRRRPAIDI